MAIYSDEYAGKSEIPKHFQDCWAQGLRWHWHTQRPKLLSRLPVTVGNYRCQVINGAQDKACFKMGHPPLPRQHLVVISLDPKCIIEIDILSSWNNRHLGLFCVLFLQQARLGGNLCHLSLKSQNFKSQESFTKGWGEIETMMIKELKDTGVVVVFISLFSSPIWPCRNQVDSGKIFVNYHKLKRVPVTTTMGYVSLLE